MEFEPEHKQVSSDDISDDQRIEAATRRLILEPLHADITPDDISDDYIANGHILDSPIANIECDTETTTPPRVSTAAQTPLQASETKYAPLTIIAIVSVFVVAIAALAVLNLR